MNQKKNKPGKVLTFLGEYYPYIITIGLILIFISGAISFVEFRGAKRFCHSNEGKYTLDFFPLPPSHYCNGQRLLQDTAGWGFEVKEFAGSFVYEFPD